MKTPCRILFSNDTAHISSGAGLAVHKSHGFGIRFVDITFPCPNEGDRK